MDTNALLAVLQRPAFHLVAGYMMGWLCTMSALAQAVPVEYHSQPYVLSSGEHNGETEGISAVFEDVIQVPGTPWLRLHIADYKLGPGSFVLLTSLADGGWQRLDAKSLPQWNHASAVFNGDSVLVELHVAPDDRDAFVNIDEVTVASLPDQGLSPADRQAKSICGDTDDRVSSNDPRVGRLFFGGATAWLASNGAVLTAGHAGNPDGNITGVMEFDVPTSMPDGTPVAANPNDQYPVNTGSIVFESNGLGHDFAVFGVNPNSNTNLRAHIAQGFFRVTGIVPLVDDTIRITGYGLDNMPAGSGGGGAPCCDADDDDVCDFNCNSASSTQQTSTGPFDDQEGPLLEYDVDSTPGNSGSPVLWENTGHVVGVHTAGGCDDFLQGYDNHGTFLDYVPLHEALADFPGPNTIYVDAVTLTAETGEVLFPFGNMADAVTEVPSGGQVSIVAGTYPASDGNTFTAGADGKAMKFIAPVGTVIIGN